MRGYFLRLVTPGVAFLFLLVSVFAFGLSSKTQASDPYLKSLQYLSSFQNKPTGGLAEQNLNSPQALQSDWSIMAFSALGYDPGTVGDSKSIVDFALSDACDLVSLTDIERRVMALESAGVDSSALSSCNLVGKIKNSADSSGRIGEDIVSSVFGVLALEAAGEEPSSSMIDYITGQQNKDGGWDSGYGTESNFTSQTIMALAASNIDVSGTVYESAKAYLKLLQTDSGGIKYDGGPWSYEPDAFSDSFAIQAIYSLGENPLDNYWLHGDASIIDDLNDLRTDDGSYKYNKTYGLMNPVWTTAVVLPALNEKFLPIFSGNFLSWQSAISTPTPVLTVTNTAPVPSFSTTSAANSTPTLTADATVAESETEVAKIALAAEDDGEGFEAVVKETATPLLTDNIPDDGGGTVLANSRERVEQLTELSNKKLWLQWLAIVTLFSSLLGVAVKAIESRYEKKI